MFPVGKGAVAPKTFGQKLLNILAKIVTLHVKAVFIPSRQFLLPHIIFQATIIPTC